MNYLPVYEQLMDLFSIYQRFLDDLSFHYDLVRKLPRILAGKAATSLSTKIINSFSRNMASGKGSGIIYKNAELKRCNLI